jgi:hypothetical protein
VRLSTPLLFHLLASWLLVGCGWRFGPPPVGPLDPGTFTGAAIEPGLRAALRRGVSDALRYRGVSAGGPTIDGEIRSFAQQPVALGRSVTGETATFGYLAELTIAARVDARPGCHVEASGQRAWSAADALTVSRERDDAVRELAAEVAARAVDLILGDPRCR